MHTRMSEINLSILIVNYNSHTHIKTCLDSIYRYSDGLNFEILILDNNSSEKGFEDIESYAHENLFTFRSPKNMGFGAGINCLYRKAKGEYLLFLNPDTYFIHNTLLDLYSFAKERNDCGICSPAIYNSNGSLNYNFNYFPDFIWEIYELLGWGYNRRLNKLSSVIIQNKLKHEPIKVDWMTGACMLIKKDLFGSIGKFDERFFLYYEDVDLQNRLVKEGKFNYCVPYLDVIHESNVSSKSEREIYYSNLLKSKLLYYSKYFNYPKRLLNKGLLLTGFILRLLFVNFRNKKKNEKQVLKKRYKDSVKIIMNY